MRKLIDKSAVVAEIESLLDKGKYHEVYDFAYRDGNNAALYVLKNKLDTLEVKEVDEKYERPAIKVTDDVSVASRMTHIDDNLKPIAEFILDYASWNLHKDEWNHPVLVVPLFRVLDALITKGKPYCGQ